MNNLRFNINFLGKMLLLVLIISILLMTIFLSITIYRNIYQIKTPKKFQIISAPANIDITKFLVKQNQKTYDTFLLQQNNNLSIFMIIITLFGFGLAIIIGLLTFFGYTSFDKQIKKVEKRLGEDTVKKATNYYKGGYIKPLEELQKKFGNLVKQLKERNIKISDIETKDSLEDKKSASKNIFEED